MAVKTNGKEWKAFYSDQQLWARDVYHEDEEIWIDGVLVGPDYDLDKVHDNAVVKVIGGTVYSDYESPIDTLEGYFKRWRRAQKFSTLIISVPKEHENHFRELTKKFGGKVLA